MEKYSSEIQHINQGATVVFNKLSNPSQYKQMLEANADKLPDNAKEALGKIRFCDDHIEIDSPMGGISLGIDNNKTVEPTTIVYTTINSPMQINLMVELTAIDENNTEAVASLELDIPFFARAMVAPQLKAAAKKLGEMLTMLPYNTENQEKEEEIS